MARAAYGGNMDVVNKMISLGATNYNWALRFSAEGGRMNILNKMISLGADDFEMAMDFAINGGNIEILRKLLPLGITDYDRFIEQAVLNNNMEMANLIDSYKLNNSNSDEAGPPKRIPFSPKNKRRSLSPSSPKDKAGSPNKKKLSDLIDVKRKLGKGMTGDVQLVENKETRKQYAMKLYNKSTRGRYKEKEINRILNSSDDFMTYVNQNFDVMLSEYYPNGYELQDYSSIKSGRMPTLNKLVILKALFDKIIDLHNKGINHRDIKSFNIILHKNGVEIIDYGLACIDPEKFVGEFNRNLICNNEYAGTPRYIDTLIHKNYKFVNKQIKTIRKEKIDWELADIYSFGIIFYEIIYPFNYGDNIDQMSVAGAWETKANLKRERIPDEYGDIIFGMISPNKEDRWSKERISNELDRLIIQEALKI